VLEEIVGAALHRARRELAAHPVDVNVPSDLPLIFVDGLLLEQVFVNLVENAARYTPPGTHVTIWAAVDGKSLRFAVQDNGPGLPKGSTERIFDKFYRGHPNVEGGRGSGLGLAICRAIAKAHGGSIVALNRPSGGAEFVVTLPLSGEAPRVVVE
jgi:two-component system sensor histidine kinase KdpD